MMTGRNLVPYEAYKGQSKLQIDRIKADIQQDARALDVSKIYYFLNILVLGAVFLINLISDVMSEKPFELTWEIPDWFSFQMIVLYIIFASTFFSQWRLNRELNAYGYYGFTCPHCEEEFNISYDSWKCGWCGTVITETNKLFSKTGATCIFDGCTHRVCSKKPNAVRCVNEDCGSDIILDEESYRLAKASSTRRIPGVAIFTWMIPSRKSPSPSPPLGRLDRDIS
jgi:hypothetical protein